MRVQELRGPLDEAVMHEAWRLRLSRALLATSALLTRLAVRLAHARARRSRPELEFYSEAGAPEGALYADGKLAGTLQGVTRL